jgi:demethylmenaquinone methyltransferase/2-methoxy-6-polyprenyl-1,4-benzoquinol methylase
MKAQEVFNVVANKYDLMNDVMSVGTHRYWKECMIDWLAPFPGMKIIDVAGGTGDVSFRFLKRVNGQGEVVVCDPNNTMTEYGKKKNQFSENIEWITAPSEKLPFENESFDAYLVSFGVRNFDNIKKALDEAHRVLKIDGRFICLEFSKVQNRELSKLYSVYSKMIPIFGKIIVGDEKPYKYLTKTIKNFPSQERFKRTIEESHFSNVEFRNLFNGVVAIHSGWKKI